MEEKTVILDLIKWIWLITLIIGSYKQISILCY